MAKSFYQIKEANSIWYCKIVQMRIALVHRTKENTFFLINLKILRLNWFRCRTKTNTKVWFD